MDSGKYMQSTPIATQNIELHWVETQKYYHQTANKQVTTKQSETYITTSFRHRHIETQVDTLATWQEYINQLPAKHKGIFQHLQVKEDRQPILQAISSRHAVAVSDGSFKDSQGTAAWVFYDNHDPKTALGEGVIMTPGGPCEPKACIEANWQGYTESSPQSMHYETSTDRNKDLSSSCATAKLS